eukprot:jgi/Chrzof1/10661/Cz05g07110.t1_LCKAS6[v5.2]
MQDAVSLLKAQAPWMVAGTVAAAGLHQFDISTSRLDATKVVLEISNTSLVLCLALVCAWVTWTWLLTAKRKVYLLDFAVHRHADSWSFPRSNLRALAKATGKFSDEDIDFQEKMIFRTGLGDETGVVPAIQSGDTSNCTMEAARDEFAATCLATVQDLLDKTGVKASQINFVITNSSLFNPTPSLSATIMNHFKMSSSTINYSLGGMGCSAGVIAIDLARKMLELHPNSYALVVSHENITNNYYAGKDKSMLIPNCLFRSNGSAVLLTNKLKDTRRAKYQLQHVVRTNMAADDMAFGCVIQTEDDERVVGVRLQKELLTVGPRAVKANMTALGPLVLPYSELLLTGGNMLLRKLVSGNKAAMKYIPSSWLVPYVPDFTKAFQHVCLHTGGRGVIDALQKQQNMSKQMVEASRATLYQYGNVSSTSIWYELAYIESQMGMKRGDKTWQLAFGSGFKVNSAVWSANKYIKESHAAWQGFQVSRMYADLDAIDEEVKASRAKKAAAQAVAAAGEKGGQAEPAAQPAAH